jgi:hypothetical protein
MDVKEQAVEWINLPRDRDQLRDVVSTVMNFRVPQCEPNFLASWDKESDPCS